MNWPSNCSTPFCTFLHSFSANTFLKNESVKFHGVFPPIAGVFTLKSRKIHGRFLFQPSSGISEMSAKKLHKLTLSNLKASSWKNLELMLLRFALTKRAI